jgi:hypothetical protein
MDANERRLKSKRFKRHVADLDGGLLGFVYCLLVLDARG